MELFILGVAIGGIMSKGGKGVVKAAAKGYLALSDKAREVSATMREEMRDAIAEAQYERDLEATLRGSGIDGGPTGAPEEIVIVTADAEPEPAPRAPRKPRAASNADDSSEREKAAKSTGRKTRSDGTPRRPYRRKTDTGAPVAQAAPSPSSAQSEVPAPEPSKSELAAMATSNE